MPDVNVLAVAVATLVGFLLSSVYYAVFASQLAAEAAAAASSRAGDACAAPSGPAGSGLRSGGAWPCTRRHSASRSA